MEIFIVKIDNTAPDLFAEYDFQQLNDQHVLQKIQYI